MWYISMYSLIPLVIIIVITSIVFNNILSNEVSILNAIFFILYFVFFVFFGWLCLSNLFYLGTCAGYLPTDDEPKKLRYIGEDEVPIESFKEFPEGEIPITAGDYDIVYLQIKEHLTIKNYFEGMFDKSAIFQRVLIPNTQRLSFTGRDAKVIYKSLKYSFVLVDGVVYALKGNVKIDIDEEYILLYAKDSGSFYKAQDGKQYPMYSKCLYI